MFRPSFQSVFLSFMTEGSSNLYPYGNVVESEYLSEDKCRLRPIGQVIHTRWVI